MGVMIAEFSLAEFALFAHSLATWKSCPFIFIFSVSVCIKNQKLIERHGTSVEGYIQSKLK